MTRRTIVEGEPVILGVPAPWIALRTWRRERKAAKAAEAEQPDAPTPEDPEPSA